MKARRKKGQPHAMIRLCAASFSRVCIRRFSNSGSLTKSQRPRGAWDEQDGYVHPCLPVGERAGREEEDGHHQQQRHDRDAEELFCQFRLEEAASFIGRLPTKTRALPFCRLPRLRGAQLRGIVSVSRLPGHLLGPHMRQDITEMTWPVRASQVLSLAHQGTTVAATMSHG